MDPAGQHGPDGRAPDGRAPAAMDHRRRSDRLPGLARGGLAPGAGEAGLTGLPIPARGGLAGPAPLGAPRELSAPYEPPGAQHPGAHLQTAPPHPQQAPMYVPQLGSPWRGQPQRSLPPGVTVTSGPLGGVPAGYGWLPYPMYGGEHLGQPGFFPQDGFVAPYPPHFVQPGYPGGGVPDFAFGAIQGLPHSALGEHFSPNALRLPFGRGRPPRTSKAPEEPSENYEFDLDEALNHPERARKTLMLRNIPNKYTIHMLLETLNKCHRSTAAGVLVYDFCYLPIDFKNRCNLGYAFVNFVDAASAAECYLAFNAKRWNDFNSKKVCEVKYARVQGREALIEHFKNSKFPGNDVDCLPLLFEQATSETGQKSVRSIPLYSRQLHSV